MKKYQISITYLYNDIVEAEDENEATEKADKILDDIFCDFRKKYFDIDVEEIQDDTNNSDHIAEINKKEEIK